MNGTYPGTSTIHYSLLSITSYLFLFLTTTLSETEGTAAVPSVSRVILFLSEALAVGTLIHGGVGLVSAHQNLIQGAVIFAGAVVRALLDGAFNAFVGMTVHTFSLLLLFSRVVWTNCHGIYAQQNP